MNNSDRTRDGQDRRQPPKPDERTIRLAPAKFSKVRADCQRIGGIAYPPYLVEWDSAQEGPAAVQQRIIQSHLAETQDNGERNTRRKDW